MSFIQKIQNQPEHIRKLILWVVVAIVGIVLAVLWFLSMKSSFEKLRGENVLSKFAPSIPEEKLNELKQSFNLAEEEFKKISEMRQQLDEALKTATGSDLEGLSPEELEKLLK